MATVTVVGLECEVTYDIIAGGILNGVLVGPGSSNETISAGPCPQVSSTVSPTVTATPSTNTCKNLYCYFKVCHGYR